MNEQSKRTLEAMMVNIFTEEITEGGVMNCTWVASSTDFDLKYNPKGKPQPAHLFQVKGTVEGYEITIRLPTFDDHSIGGATYSTRLKKPIADLGIEKLGWFGGVTWSSTDAALVKRLAALNKPATKVMLANRQGDSIVPTAVQVIGNELIVFGPIRKVMPFADLASSFDTLL